MKIRSLLFTTFVCLMIASCIPSLHPIATKEDYVLDDRLVGDWMLKEESFSDNINIKYSVSVESDEESEASQQAAKADLQQYMDSLLVNERISHWKFERASNFTILIDKKASNAGNESRGAVKMTMKFKNSATNSIIKKYEKKYGKESVKIKDKKDLSYYYLTYREDLESKKEYLEVLLTKIEDDYYLDFYPTGKMFPDEGRFAANIIRTHTFAKVEFKDGKIIMSPFNAEKLTELIEKNRIRLKHEVVNDNILLTASTKELRTFIAKYGKEQGLFDDSQELIARK